MQGQCRGRYNHIKHFNHRNNHRTNNYRTNNGINNRSYNNDHDYRSKYYNYFKKRNNNEKENNDNYKETDHNKKSNKRTTTKKKAYDPDPAYGTVKFSIPTGNYKVDHWSCGHVYWTWNGTSWEVWVKISGGMHTPCNEEDFINRCLKAYPQPKRDGKYNGEEVDKAVYIWN